MSKAQKITIAKNQSQIVHEIQTDTVFEREYHLEPYANLILMHEQKLSDSAQAISNVQFILGQGSSLHYIPIFTDGIIVDAQIMLDSDHASYAQVNGAYALHAQQEYTIKTRQHHRGKGSTSALIMNGIAADRSTIHYHGTIAVEKNASQTNGSQENKTILWGNQARAFSIPSLEVETNEVQCAHGSAIGPMNADHIRYAQSRGISISQAQRLLLKSFFANAIGALQNESIRADIINRLVSKILEN